MQLPSREKCFELFKKYQTPEHIIQHSLAVNKIANYLAQQFINNDIQVNIDLIDRASLLHDIVRLCQEKHHAEAASDIFQYDYPEMAQVILKHRLTAVIRNMLQTWEEKIVYYADKRVNHDQLVSIDIRMAEGHKRWKVKKSDDERKMILQKMHELETEIFKLIKKDPHAINEL